MSHTSTSKVAPSYDMLLPKAARERFAFAEEGNARLLRRIDKQANLFMGDLSYTSIPEVLTLINTGRRSGDLILQFDVARKKLSFVDGEVMAVSSNVEDDRLGEVMWRAGIISLDQLMIAASQLGESKKKIGRLLVDNGFIASKQLFAGLRAQVREILLSVFHFRGGMFCFIGHTPRAATPIRLEESTESLIMTGVRQLDELMRLRNMVGDLDAEISLESSQLTGVKLREVESAIFQLLVSARETMTVRNILDKCHVGEFQGLRALNRLIKLDAIRSQSQQQSRQKKRDKQDPLSAAVSVINTITQKLHDDCDGADRWVRVYLEDIEVADMQFFEHVPIGDKTQLDVEILRQKAASISHLALQQLCAAMRDTVDFAMFQASETLDEDAAGELFAQVAGRLSATRGEC